MSIKIENLTHVYMPKSPFEKKALDNVNLVIEDGEFLALIGHTGSGKSTLIQHLNGLLEPTSGRILVDDIDEAIDIINHYGSGHSEAIITKDYGNSQKFLQKVDAAAVYVNASTRFTDGEEFGFGAEIGISTQKLHARGPMGLKELTTIKYIIYGNGQIR